MELHRPPTRYPKLRSYFLTAAKLWIAHVRKLNLPPALDFFAGVEDRVMSAATERVSVREAVERYSNLTGVRALRVAPDVDLGELSVFFWVARKMAREMDPTSDRFTRLVPNVDPYDCPSFRLRMALLRSRRSATKEAQPSDMIDADHLAYAAHVDRAFVDKRTLHYLQQEARRRSALLPEVSVRRIFRASSLNDLFPST